MAGCNCSINISYCSQCHLILADMNREVVFLKRMVMHLDLKK